LQLIAEDWDRFQDISREVIHNPRYATMTVDEFIDEMNFSREFYQCNLFACISGMYFVDDRSPESMPIRAIMNYYHLQKGVGLSRYHGKSVETSADHESPRHYFVNGASDWIRQLAQYLQDSGVEMRVGAIPAASLQNDGSWHVVSSSPQQDVRSSFDAVISAVHADVVQDVVQAGLPTRLPSLLNEFSYSESTAFVHDDISILPVDQRAWCTYNLTIYHDNRVGETRPYSITYLERKHHGKDENGAPFVTLMPRSMAVPDHVYDMLNLPADDKIKAVVQFRHNRLSMASFIAQKNLRELQGENNLYLTGGWTIGVGLHEEILAMSREVALRIRGYFVDGLHDEGYRDDQPSYVPKYIRDTFVETPELFPPGFWE
jgi:predicted NAD/FAD-binding protein